MGFGQKDVEETCHTTTPDKETWKDEKGDEYIW